MPIYGGIEAGGTKFICAIGQADGTLIDTRTVPTSTPEETLPAILAFFKDADLAQPLSALGLGCFGPVDLDTDSPTFGHITSSTKLAWKHFPIKQALSDALNLPVTMTTDVNAAALGEYHWGAAHGLCNVVYMTVGTGIGACALLNGKPLHGLTHPEMGHLLVSQDPDDAYAGICPYHNNCLEGLACGEAIKARWSVASALDLPPDHEAWTLEADYLAKGLCNLLFTLAPERFILGGGVMRQQQLYQLVRDRLPHHIAGYFTHEAVTSKGLADTIVAPTLAHPGVHGAIALAAGLAGND